MLALLLLPLAAAYTSIRSTTLRPSASAYCTDPVDFEFPNCGPVGQLSYLSPALSFAPDGAWRHTRAGRTNGSGSVSVQLSSSGVVWEVVGNATLLVDGEERASGNGTHVSVAGLEYGWHNYTLLASGDVRDPRPLEDGSPFLPAAGGTSQDLTTANISLFSSTGFGYPGVSTNGSARLVLSPPPGTALLELLGNYQVVEYTHVFRPPMPWGAFSVSFDPPPPFGPATQHLKGSLYPPLGGVEGLEHLKKYHALVFRAELDPAVTYKVTVETGGGQVGFDAVGVYGSYWAWREAGGTVSVVSERTRAPTRTVASTPAATGGGTPGATGGGTAAAGGGTAAAAGPEPSSHAMRVSAAAGALAVVGAALLLI
jgi:hypothetical protein